MIIGVGVVLIVPIAMDRAFAANANRSADTSKKEGYCARFILPTL